MGLAFSKRARAAVRLWTVGLLRRRAILWAALAGVVFAPSPLAAQEIRVAVAANFRAAMDDVGPFFEEATGYDLVLVTGSTGALAAQIVNGAPYDVFLAADRTRPERLIETGHAVAESRVTYAVGRLVLWDPEGGAVGPDRLREGPVRRLALADPKLAPYGAAAMETLENLGLRGALEGRLVMAGGVGQAFAYARTGAADLAFIALSQLLSLPPAERGGYWITPEDAHTPLAQDAVLLAGAQGNRAAENFLAFLTSPEAHNLITRRGYQVE